MARVHLWSLIVQFLGSPFLRMMLCIITVLIVDYSLLILLRGENSTGFICMANIHDAVIQLKLPSQ